MRAALIPSVVSGAVLPLPPPPPCPPPRSIRPSPLLSSSSHHPTRITRSGWGVISGGGVIGFGTKSWSQLSVCGLRWSSSSGEWNGLSKEWIWIGSVGSPHRRLFLEGRQRGICSEGKMSTGSLVLRLLASSVRVADRAGNIVRDIMSKGDLQIVDKGVNDLQTEADRSVQRCIMASLNSQFPNVTVIGEEEATTDLDPDWVEISQSEEVLACDSKLPQELKDVAEKDICVWVDPLDGTNEYTQGLLDHVTVLIGIAVNGKAVAGVMHQPYYNYEAGPDATLGRTIWGIVGVGAFGIERKPLGSDTRIVVTTRSHETEAVRNAIAACEPTEVIRVGGAGHKVLLLIEGEAHAYIFASAGCKKWDTCAPEAVLRAIGGTLTDIHGNDYQYHPSVVWPNTGGVLATAFASDQAWYLSRMPAEVTAQLPSS